MAVAAGRDGVAVWLVREDAPEVRLLAQFTFRRRNDGVRTIEFAPELQDDPASWQFSQYTPTPNHRMAVAVRRGGADLGVTVDEVIPEAPG
jgi:hypothetical protein